MARQSKDQVVKFIGIDPGEAHCGWARVNMTSMTFKVEIGTYSIADHGFASLVDRLVPEEKAVVAVEEYRARAVGHQKFNDGRTAQLIGGIRYRVNSLDHDMRFVTVPPADPIGDLKRYRLDALVDFLEQGRIQRGNPRWDHAFSALRILVAGMFKLNTQSVHSLGSTVIERLSESTVYDGDLSSGVVEIMR